MARAANLIQGDTGRTEARRSLLTEHLQQESWAAGDLEGPGRSRTGPDRPRGTQEGGHAPNTQHLTAMPVFRPSKSRFLPRTRSPR